MQPESRTDYRICSRCILDTLTYPDIQLDENGVCDICHIFNSQVKNNVKNGAEGKAIAEKIVRQIKEEGSNKEYDCIIGLSGGVDSSYLCLLASRWNLRPLVVHVDNGWNSELAVFNIENIVKKLNFDLYTYVINWEDMKNMHLAFLRASVVDIELPFDNMFMATLFKVARKFSVKTILLGINFLTEGYLPPNFNHNKLDSLNIKDIFRKFSGIPLLDFPMINKVKRDYYTRILGYRTISLLNYIDYNKEPAKTELENTIGWRDYKEKHYENVFTRFYQGYILPVKFKIDKRKAHLSTLVCSGQLSRYEALQLSAAPAYKDSYLCLQDLEFVLKKLDIPDAEFERILQLPVKKHSDYKSVINIYKRIRRFRNLILFKNEKER